MGIPDHVFLEETTPDKSEFPSTTLWNFEIPTMILMTGIFEFLTPLLLEIRRDLLVVVPPMIVLLNPTLSSSAVSFSSRQESKQSGTKARSSVSFFIAAVPWPHSPHIWLFEKIPFSSQNLTKIVFPPNKSTSSSLYSPVICRSLSTGLF